MPQPCPQPRRVVLATPPVYQAPLPLEVHLPMIPQGPAMIAAVLRARGHHVACFDAYERSCRRGYFDASEFAEFLLAERPGWLGLSVYSDGFPSALRMIEVAKAVLPDCAIVVGGPHFTLFPDAVTTDVDFVVVGEGELPMAALVEDMLPITSSVSDRREVLFLVAVNPARSALGAPVFHVSERAEHKVGGADIQAVAAEIRRATNGHSCVVSMQGRLANETLGRLPYPAYDLFLGPDVTYQFDEPALGLDGPMLNLNTSRGCTYGCSFCSVEGVWGKSYRWFPTDWILGLVAELQQRYGLRSVFFREDEFIMRPRAASAWRSGAEGQDDVLALARGLHALGVRWAVENRADAFGSSDRAEYYFKTLATLGLAGVFVGVESASDRVRNQILNKHLAEGTLRAFFSWAHEADVRTVANVMYGVRRRVGGELLCDTREDWAATDALLAALRPTRVDRYVYVGVPVSPLYFDHLERGDYDLIDVNGYLYPRAFGDIAREIYGHDVEMAVVPGRPNLRVGPGLLPGIPTATDDAPTTPETIAATLRRLAELPGVLEVTLTPLGRNPELLPVERRVGCELLALLPFRSLGGAMVGEILRRYRPGERATIQRLTCGPTFIAATLRSPSAEVVLLALHLAHDVVSCDALLFATTRTAALVNNYFRAEFVDRFAAVSSLAVERPAPRRHLQVVQR